LQLLITCIIIFPYTTLFRSILLDGVPLSEYALDNLRQQIALVNQNVVLFNDTVAGNIAYGALAGTDEAAIHRAADAANATEFIEDRKSTRLNSSHVKISYAV